jgi:RNA polymerase sigma factor (sigma-70 family)
VPNDASGGIKWALEEETDECLFLCMAFDAEEPELSRRAFDVLYRRYSKAIYARCLGLCRRYRQGDTVAENLVADTFYKAKVKAETFRGSDDPDPTVVRRRTIGWLCKIAERLLFDKLRNPRRPGVLDEVDMDVHVEHYSAQEFATLFMKQSGVQATLRHYQLVAEAFDALQERTQIVLLETLLQREYSPSEQYMRRGSVRALAQRVGTTPENIRRIRLKGMRAINEYVSFRLGAEGSVGGRR